MKFDELRRDTLKFKQDTTDSINTLGDGEARAKVARSSSSDGNFRWHQAKPNGGILAEDEGFPYVVEVRNLPKEALGTNIKTSVDDFVAKEVSGAAFKLKAGRCVANFDIMFADSGKAKMVVDAAWGKAGSGTTLGEEDVSVAPDAPVITICKMNPKVVRLKRPVDFNRALIFSNRFAYAITEDPNFEPTAKESIHFKMRRGVESRKGLIVGVSLLYAKGDDLWHIAELSLSDAYAGAFALGHDFGEVFKGSDDEQRMKNIFKVIEGDFNKGLPTRK